MQPFIIQASDLKTNNACRIDHGSIIYESDASSDSILFYGPYIRLDPGVYLFSFQGELDGTLFIDFAHRYGFTIRKAEIDNFAEPICLAAARPLEHFEVRGFKTPRLNALRLEAISVSLIYQRPEES